VETASEVLVFFKTTAARFQAFQEKLKSLHPYETPEIVSFRIDHGLPDYLQWVAGNCDL
jgi:periplasmic divalent cation tolerance protein